MYSVKNIYWLIGSVGLRIENGGVQLVFAEVVLTRSHLNQRLGVKDIDYSKTRLV
jgi:hypothetical protein